MKAKTCFSIWLRVTMVLLKWTLWAGQYPSNQKVTGSSSEMFKSFHVQNQITGISLISSRCHRLFYFEKPLSFSLFKSQITLVFHFSFLCIDQYTFPISVLLTQHKIITIPYPLHGPLLLSLWLPVKPLGNKILGRKHNLLQCLVVSLEPLSQYVPYPPPGMPLYGRQMDSH